MDTAQHIAPGIQGAASAAALREGLGPLTVGVLSDRSLFRSGRVHSELPCSCPSSLPSLGAAFCFSRAHGICAGTRASTRVTARSTGCRARTYSCEYNGLSGTRKEVPPGDIGSHEGVQRDTDFDCIRLKGCRAQIRGSSARAGAIRYVGGLTIATRCRLRGCASGFTLRLAACNRSPTFGTYVRVRPPGAEHELSDDAFRCVPRDPANDLQPPIGVVGL
jgi:hypothetical protein